MPLTFQPEGGGNPDDWRLLASEVDMILSTPDRLPRAVGTLSLADYVISETTVQELN